MNKDENPPVMTGTVGQALKKDHKKTASFGG